MKPSFIKDYITVYDDVITSKSCDDLVNFFEKNVEKSFKEEKKDKSFQELNLQYFPQYRDETNELFKSFVDKYQKDNNIPDSCWPSSYELENTRFKKYLPNSNDRFDLHTDATIRETSTRFLAFFIYLTDNELGHTSFPTRDIKIQPKKGKLLMFPPNFCYPHIGEKVTDKPKYIIGNYCHVMPLTNNN
jgi:hypothetical protein